MTTFDLRRVRVRSGEQHRELLPVAIAPLELGGQRYISVPEEVDAELEVTRASSGTVFELRFPVRLHGPCMRCLRDAVIEDRLDLREYQATSPGESDELSTPYLENGNLDISAWARDALVLTLPTQILCKPDCAGLCPICGKDLNTEPHTHEEAEIDPRWSALEELKKQL
jgi:DUF177 domain-containing protein